MKLRNPFGFYEGPVTFVLCVVYVGIITGLLYVHHVVPQAPAKAVPVKGLNVTEAWRDLQYLSSGFHPYNSKQNDVVRNWLLTRIGEILKGNDVSYEVEQANAPRLLGHISHRDAKDLPPVVVFNDLASNTSTSAGDYSVYFEGTNIMVYVRGTEDGEEDWWRQPEIDNEGKPRGVLVNAHYDSVASGFGATDDGVGVVSILQLIKYYTTSGHRPKRGFVALFNNGEEDWLNGARAFLRHPLSRFPDTFVNLEGAGAGGRATLFRSTDAEVTKSYRKSKYPFGSVISSDAFNRGLIRSQTDYIIFNGEAGMRGLDVAFFEPRSRYHTTDDSARHTSKDSIWHMLSTAIATTKDLTSNTKTDFTAGKGSRGVWFDVFGRVFGLINVDQLFGLSIALLVVAPVLLIGLAILLTKLDKYYLFARKARSDPLDPHSPDESAVIEFNGWRGLTRFPLAIVAASAAVVGLAFLLNLINPLILYSSEYAVWSMMLSAWIFIAWFVLRGADVMRPSALQRAHALGWMFFGSYVLLVASTAAENMRHIAGVYPVAIYLASVFLALLISYLELLALPKKHVYLQHASHNAVDEDEQTPPAPSHRRGSSIGSRPRSSRDGARASRDDDEATETTSLLGNRRVKSRGQGSIDARNARERAEDESTATRLKRKLPFGEEQGWSGHLPSSLWLLQFLILAPVNLIIIGPIALFLTSALHQTPADGSPILFIYLCTAGLSILLLLPASPFLHRINSRIPIFLLFVFAGTLIYNLTAFPFSPQNRLKVFFRQDLDIDTAINTVSLTGIDGYVQNIITNIPSAGGQNIKCETPELKAKEGLVTCKWHGLPPNVVEHRPGKGNITLPPYLVPPEKRYRDWLLINATRGGHTANEGSARIQVGGRNTRACRLRLESLINDFDVKGSAEQKNKVSKDGATQVRLWSREWENVWDVSVRYDLDNSTSSRIAFSIDKKEKKEKKGRGLDGRAECLWSDANTKGVIPAFDEVQMYMPDWSILTKLEDGLVVGYKRFLV